MKRYSSHIIILTLLIAACSSISSCKKNFAEINTDTRLVTSPNIKYLLTYSEDYYEKYQGTEWVWETMEQLFRFTQHATAQPYEMTNNVNSRYSAFYANILPNLLEIRRQVAGKSDSANYQKAIAVTYVLQVMQGLKVTDMNGSIAYSQADLGRYDANFNPVYDAQDALFTNMLAQLNSAISVLSNTTLANQNSYGSSDVYYNSDWIKWAKLANTLKLRIAARLDIANNALAKTIFQQVLQDPNGAITANADQLSYKNIDYEPFGRGTGSSVNYRSTRFGTTSMVNFMKSVNDPRLAIYFEKNSLVGSYKDTLNKYSVTLPSFINPSDPLIQFQGGPADFTTNPTVAAYLTNTFPVGSNRYNLISPLNRNFFVPTYGIGGSTAGGFLDVIVTAAEGCFLTAEFIQKGYAGSVATNGTAEDWYKKGITSSIQTMNNIAIAAPSPTGFTGDGSAEITAYLNNSGVKFNGTNNLERIYIQEYLNYFRNGNEAFVFCRRTGYPKLTSTYYAREVFNEVIPRRFWTINPGQLNRDNWNAAMTAQGFTPNAQDLQTLSTQRIWYDKTAPDFGKGN
ncbi:MAG: SusD/RagB family nutrient-binding outer membrane lipoprotein [Chitinophagaceae bacterium]